MTSPLLSRGRYLALVIVLAVFAALFHIGHARRRAANELRDAGGEFFRIALLPRSYAQAHDGLWPPLDPQTRALALPLDMLPSGYTIASKISAKMTKPIPAILLGKINNAGAYTLAPVDSVAARYVYFGYAVTNDREFAALAEALQNGASPEEDISVTTGNGTFGSEKLYRLRENLAETLTRDGVVIEDAANPLSRIPVLMERPHDGHAWVLYLNRDLQYESYPGPFPMSAAVIASIGPAEASE